MYNRYFFLSFLSFYPILPYLKVNSIILAASPPIVSKSLGGGSARQGRAVKDTRSAICVAPQHTKKGVVTPQTIATIRKLAESVDIFGCDDNITDRIAFNYSLKAGDEDS